LAYSDTRIVLGGLNHVTVIIVLANFFKGKFGIKTEEVKNTLVKEELAEIIEVKDAVIKEGKFETISKLSNKLDNIEKKANEVYEKIKNKKKEKKKKRK